MRGKRSKQYRKLMEQYALNFGFREPFQVLLDADIIRDACRYKMDLIAGLERTLHGKVKPMITQCSMRHLYASASDPGISHVIEQAKSYERRRCGHLPSEYPVPLSAQSCITSVVDPKNNEVNKHRYVVASQDLNVRKAMRDLMGVPLVYINRSVMIMEPMAGKTTESIVRDEQVKLRAGAKRGTIGLKRKRNDGQQDGQVQLCENGSLLVKKKISRGPKGPNPLSVKKPIVKNTTDGSMKISKTDQNISVKIETMPDMKEDAETFTKRRKRKHKSSRIIKSSVIISDHENKS
ncbi:rRNA-processing protein utp23 [Erysiphe neolycopersici]|uniref:U three protein 23 n=1 Tax=Erysiphe neolycopersici TaxID=212602 RepID=A0A420HSE3_9PEZI|nr:rRNA-processing protein utp23 [Erysiphe neolycopersici]